MFTLQSQHFFFPVAGWGGIGGDDACEGQLRCRVRAHGDVTITVELRDGAPPMLAYLLQAA